MTKYTDLITSEHATKPKFVEVIGVSTQAEIDQISVVSAFPQEYDLDTAVGVQLDAVGKWVGVGRQILTPLSGVYFALDTARVGFDQGYWLGPFDPTSGVTVLPDDAYRLLLRATIALNYWDGSIQQALDALQPLFPDNQIAIQDNQDMTISVIISGPPLDVISGALLVGGYLALKPATVHINYLFSSAPSGPVFGFDVENGFLGGFDVGSWGASSPFTGA